MSLFLTFVFIYIWYFCIGDNMKVKIFDETHEKDLEESVNNFIEDKEIIDIKYQVAISINGEEQLYCFSAMIVYRK